MSNIYCNYNNKKYKAKRRNNIIIITSKIKQNGFINYIDILGKEHSDLFMKEVSFDEVEAVYEENIEVAYKGLYFQILTSVPKMADIQSEQLRIVTESEKLAKELDFEKLEQFVFIKKISIKEIEKIKIIQKPIKEFESYGVREIMIEKEDISNWLKTFLD